MDHVGGILGCLGVVIFIALSWIIIFGIIVIPIYTVLGLYAGLKFFGTNIFIALDKVFYPGFDAPVIVAWGFWGLIGGIAIQGYREIADLRAKRSRDIDSTRSCAFVGSYGNNQNY